MKLTKLQKNTAAFSLAGLSLLSLAGLVSAQSNLSPTVASTARSATTNTTRTAPTAAERAAHDALHTAIKTAITNGDYTAFQTAIASMEAQKPADAPTMPTITESQFATIVQAEKLRASGDTAGAKKLLDDAGIKGSFIGGKDGGMGGHRGGHGGPDTANMTDAQKTAMEQARTLRDAGKDDEAKAVMTAAGITMRDRGEMSAEMKAFEASLTDTQKAVLKQSHDLMKSGDKAGADKLLTDAGITLPARPDHRGQSDTVETTTTNQ